VSISSGLPSPQSQGPQVRVEGTPARVPSIEFSPHATQPCAGQSCPPLSATPPQSISRPELPTFSTRSVPPAAQVSIPPIRSPLRGTWCPDRCLCSPPSPPHARNLCVQSSAFLFYFFATRPHCDFDSDLNVDGRTLPKKSRRQRIPGADELLSCALIRQRKSESGKLCRRRGNQRSF